jgi:hypothetical protein
MLLSLFERHIKKRRLISDLHHFDLEKLKRRIQEGKYEDKEKATRKEIQLLFTLKRQSHQILHRSK